MATSVLPEEISLEWSPHRISCTELHSWFKNALTLGRIRVKIYKYLHVKITSKRRQISQMSDTSHALIIFFSLIKNAADCSYKIALFKYWILLYYYDRKIFHNCFATYRISLIIKSSQDFLFEKYWILLLKLAEIFQLLFCNLLIIQ